MKKLVPALLLLTTLLAACSKDDHISMRTEKLTTGTWRLADYRTLTVVNGKATDTSLYSTIQSYRLDNRFRFLPEGNIATLEGKIKLLPQIPDSSITGKWAFSEADTKIALTDTTMGGLFEIMRFTDTEMVFSVRIVGEKGDGAVISRTYKR